MSPTNRLRMARIAALGRLLAVCAARIGKPDTEAEAHFALIRQADADAPKTRPKPRR